jgi:hypothetical protein
VPIYAGDLTGERALQCKALLVISVGDKILGARLVAGCATSYFFGFYSEARNGGLCRCRGRSGDRVPD